MKPLPMIPSAMPHMPETPETAKTEFAADAEKTAALKPAIFEVISTVFDPEIPVNIVELGLIYDVAVDASGMALVTMTLTAPGCPAAQSLPSEVGSKVKSVAGVTDAKVDVVWEPGWTKDRMSEAAKLQLGLW
jgi:FeS assembly SUF system protein